MSSPLTGLAPLLPSTPASRLALAQAESSWEDMQRQLERLRGWNERLRLLAAEAPAILLGKSTAAVASDVLRLLGQVLGAERGIFALAHPNGAFQVIAESGECEGIRWSEGVVARCLDSGEPAVVADALRDQDLRELRSVSRARMRSICCLPILAESLPLGFVWLENRSIAGVFEPLAVEIARAWLLPFGEAIDRTLREAHGSSIPVPGFLTLSTRLQAELRDLARLASFDVPVLLYGETGTGKSMLARALHRISPRSSGPFVHVNCGAIPEALIEGELFGAEKGAFTGALQRRIGHFEAAQKGTLFLDELDSMPVAAQVRLLVALQERTITRLGSSQPIPVDVRVIAALGRPPQVLVQSGQLRADLYYRLGAVVTHLPPLRERLEDLPMLCEGILDRVCSRHQRPLLSLSREALNEALAWPWPGNIRELENTLERAALLSQGLLIHHLRLPPLPSLPAPPAVPLPQPTPSVGGSVGRKGGAISNEEFREAMVRAEGDPGQVAVILGIHRRSVMRILARMSAHAP